MPMEWKDIAAVSGKGGLYKVIKPSRSGVLLESLDEKKNRLVAGATQRVSILKEISIYTTDAEGTVALCDLMRKIKAELGSDLGVEPQADKDELLAFLGRVLPQFDPERVYASDVKRW